MKKKIKLLKYLFFLSLFFLFLLYLLPNELIEIKSDSDKPKSIFAGSIKHFYFFSYLTSLGLFAYSKDKYYSYIVFLLFLLSASIEVIHLYVPYRQFSYFDILGNVYGYLFGFLLTKSLKKYFRKDWYE